MYKVAGKREHNARKCLNLCDHTKFSRTHNDLSALIYGVSIEICGLGTTFMEMLRRLAHDLRDPTVFSPLSRSDRRTLAFVLSMLKTNAVTRRSLANMATTARCLAYLPRLYHAYGDIGALWAHFSSPYRSAVRMPPRYDGGFRVYTSRPTMFNAM